MISLSFKIPTTLLNKLYSAVITLFCGFNDAILSKNTPKFKYLKF